MLCDVYRSLKKADTYLYLPHGNEFDDVPDVLCEQFGRAEKVLTINLAKREQLARLTVEKLQEHLHNDGFYLQLPPKREELQC
ncbi:YcgL domain-containing protein [Idiomarina sp. HP20-50]|uniref:YcgL domain-containing protein n=1 Tax=Idiomarina sp. HP20-50 TaxID=3070813 RepID=UPI00294AE8B2|nr:YcgL domain-containing protein [Idiomarina sp. HP20-50]MDV6317184.1 YcgL domain-containing protein [Idiomarina sp. HP20-50]